MEGKGRRADPGKGPLLLGLAVGLGLQLGYNTPPPSQSIFCCCNPLPLPHLHHRYMGFAHLEELSCNVIVHPLLHTSCTHDM